MVAHLNKALFALLLTSAAGQAAAQDRTIRRADEATLRKHALIVGNDAYRRSPLVNAVNDAHSMRRTLRDMGFSVETVTDADYPTFDRAVDLFVDRLRRGDVALFYYAGHGVQVDGGNYLIPVDFDATRVAKVKYRAMPADLIRERMEDSGARLSILILDACRDNPFHGNRSAGPGLAQMATGIGTFIAFSTAPGQTAADNPSGGNGLFTEHLIRTLETPGLSIDQVFNEVRSKVFQESDGRQIPWTATSLIGSFFFRPEPPPAPAPDRPRVTVSRRQATGSLEVTVNVPGAEIYLDGELVATSAGAETIRLGRIQIGDYLVRVSKPAHREVVRGVRVASGATASLDAWLSPNGSQTGASTPRPPWPAPPPVSLPPSGTADLEGEFCATLEQVLMACPDQFRDIVVPSGARTRTFLEPTVTLPGAWYNKVYRAGPDRCEYLSSFEADLDTSPGGRLEDFVSRVEACLPAGTIAWHQRRATRHQLQVALAPGDCRLEIAVNRENVDLEIYQGGR